MSYPSPQAPPNLYGGNGIPVVDALPPGATPLSQYVTQPPPSLYAGGGGVAPPPPLHMGGGGGRMDRDEFESDFDEPAGAVTMHEDGPFQPRHAWAHGVCECGCGCDTCCASFWFHPLQTSKLHSALIGEEPSRACGNNLPTGIMAVGAGIDLLGSVLSGVSPSLASISTVGLAVLLGHHCYVRQQVARRIGVREGACTSCLCATFCAPCSSVQMTDTLAAPPSNPRIRLCW